MSSSHYWGKVIDMFAFCRIADGFCMTPTMTERYVIVFELQEVNECIAFVS